jgi:hypothetical protein
VRAGSPASSILACWGAGARRRNPERSRGSFPRISRIYPWPCRCKAFFLQAAGCYRRSVCSRRSYQGPIFRCAVSWAHLCRKKWGSAKLREGFEAEAPQARNSGSPAWPKARNARCRGKCWVSKRNPLFPLCRRPARSASGAQCRNSPTPESRLNRIDYIAGKERENDESLFLQ